MFEQAFYRLILLIQKNKKINILSVPFISLNFPPTSGAKKGSVECILTISPHLLSKTYLYRVSDVIKKKKKNKLALWKVDF